MDWLKNIRLVKMKKPKYLYHGSAKKIIGNELKPRKAHDLEKRAENLHSAVYASSDKEISLAMAIISCKGVMSASLGFKKKPYGIIFEGWPKQNFIYLYTLLSDNFVQSKKGSKQWHSIKKVKPVKIEKIKVKDYLYLVRKTSREETKRWLKKYGLKPFHK